MKRSLLIGLYLFGFGTFAADASGVWFFRAASNDRVAVSNSNQSLTLLQQARADMLEAESSALAYLLKGEQRDLDGFADARQQASLALNQTAVYDPAQQDRMSDVSLLQEILAEWCETIKAHMNTRALSGLDASAKEYGEGNESALTDELKLALSKCLVDERAKQKQNELVYDREQSHIALSALIGILCNAAFLVSILLNRQTNTKS
jgi:CHASE3 domain sensor protein